MVTFKRIIIKAVLFLVLTHSIASGALLVNEVMSNEPGSNTSLEWIELLNTDTTSNFSLVFYTIDANGTTLPFLTETVRGDPYIVVCQNLIAFESVWGDGSGVWGDTEAEDYPLFQKTEDFSLNNNSGTVILYYLANNISSLTWTSAGADGVSWERFSPDSAEVYQSIDPSGSTPGRRNSRTPMPHDLALLSVKSRPIGSGETNLEFAIANVGLETVTKDSLYIFADPEQDSVVNRNDLIAVAALPDMDPEDTIQVSLNFEFEGYYVDLLARLFADDRAANNTILFSAPGQEYPPVVLSEFLADPTTSSQNEWIELKNRSDREIDIANWYLADGDILYPIISGEFIVESGEYIVLCRDSLDFVDFYGQPDYPVIKMTGWPALNNQTDSLKLVDNFGTPADSFTYDSTYGGNYTWARGEVSGYTDTWGRSVDAGGTPGAENVIHYPASSSTIELTAEPNPFSPSRDHEMIITFSLPTGTFDLKLYDIEGRVVKTFVNDYYAYDGSISWDGYSDGGRRLPVGIYILYAEVIDREHYKQTIVIAP